MRNLPDGFISRKKSSLNSNEFPHPGWTLTTDASYYNHIHPISEDAAVNSARQEERLRRNDRFFLRLVTFPKTQEGPTHEILSPHD